tara:strand:- start:239 stop:433 length:195 start_codon:yes stop_codon:yes gene_type:complete
VNRNTPAFEKERIERINYLMSEIHDATNEIYEGFIDREYLEVKKNVTHLIRHLKNVIESVEDEI